ncbi:hypothetical protein [Amycolatopsis aidingensis]|uniref:hypothetical protein n=1 Tax=Amycolatopsis aidingensis TaxID=2842453 RepID=UPI001C0E41E4|nr:hypothetical protein [Amycolatopsis aidingensis]
MVVDSGEDFIADIARPAVAAVAPQELPLFSATCAAYLRDPERALAGRRRRDETLGSGIETIVELVSPIALAVATAVYQQLIDRAGEAVTRGTGRLFARLRRKAIDTSRPVPRTPLSAEQRADLREVAEARARALGLADEQVQLLVGAIMDGLQRREEG